MINLNDLAASRATFEHKLRLSGVPDHLHEGITAYVFDGRPVGHFLTAVFEDRFTEAFNRADAANTAAMADIASFMYNEIPLAARGPENVRKWIETGGLVGGVRG